MWKGTKLLIGPLVGCAVIMTAMSPGFAADGSEPSTGERAGIRCVAAGTVAATVTLLVTQSPSMAAAGATAACAIAAGEEVIASELEKGVDRKRHK
jgi:hypothetical protein